MPEPHRNHFASPGTGSSPSIAIHVSPFHQPPPLQGNSLTTFRALPLQPHWYHAIMHVVWHRAVGAAAVVLLCILDAAQSTPVAPKRSLDSTELYYGAQDGDEATSSYKPIQKKARTSSDAGGATPQQVRRPLLDLNKVPSSHSLDKMELSSGARLPLEVGTTSAHKHPDKQAMPSSSARGANSQQMGSTSSDSMSSTPPSTRQSSSDAYESHLWSEKQSEPSTSDAFRQVQIPRRPRSSRAKKGTRGAGEAWGSSLKTRPATHTSTLLTDDFDFRGKGSLTMAPGKLWHEPAEVLDLYSTKGVIKAKALAIQQHVPWYPTDPKDYNFTPRRSKAKNSQLLSQEQITGHNKHVRRTYARIAKNQDKGLPLLKDVPLMQAKDFSVVGRQRRPRLPPGAVLQDYRTFLSEDGKRQPGAVVSRQQRQKEASMRENFLDGRRRAAANIKETTDARVLEKAIKVRKHYGSHVLVPEEYEYEPSVPMDKTSKEFQVKQRENWIMVTNRRFKKLAAKLDDTRGKSSSSSARSKRPHRRRGGL